MQITEAIQDVTGLSAITMPQKKYAINSITAEKPGDYLQKENLLIGTIIILDEVVTD